MPYVVYILKCADGTLYTGITTDPKRRLAEHKKGVGGAYTASHGAQKMIFTEHASSRSNALKREAEIKRLSRPQKLSLIKRGRASLPRASRQ